MGEQKVIYCPRCGRRVACYDGRSTMYAIGDCKKCGKRMVYKPISGETEVKPIPPRSMSSGKAFY